MKLHCNRCGKDFTTLSERDKDKKFGIHHLILDKMKCPHCGASNYGYRSGGKWNPFSREMSDVNEPAVIVHPQCRPFIGGNLLSPEGISCNCTKACKSFFNCWTGNVDDGDYQVPVEKSREEQVKDAKAYMEKKRKDDAQKALENLRVRLGKIGFGYEFKPKGVYARYGGTVWVLSDKDVESILRNTWDAAQTIVIYRTFRKRGVNPALARILLHAELALSKGT